MFFSAPFLTNFSIGNNWVPGAFTLIEGRLAVLQADSRLSRYLVPIFFMILFSMDFGDSGINQYRQLSLRHVQMDSQSVGLCIYGYGSSN